MFSPNQEKKKKNKQTKKKDFSSPSSYLGPLNPQSPPLHQTYILD